MKIVFAHFNSKIPKYLVLNLKRTILLFPLHKVYLITDQDVSKIQITNLSVSKYHPSDNWNDLEKLIQHPKFFRNNFWFTSLARLIAIAEFVKNHNEEVLHIESDVIISDDFPLQVFSKLNVDFSFPVVSSDLAIASCLFIGNSRAADELIRITLESATENNLTTDMYVLNRLTKSKTTKFQLLPSSTSSKEALDNSNMQFLHKTKEALSIYSGIFDGADIGMYLFGEDPRNNRGFSKLRTRKYVNYLNVRKLLIINRFNREFPYVFDSENDIQIPVFSLHIHSKNPNLFKVNRIRKTISKSVKDSGKDPRTIFSPMTFIWAVKNSTIRRIRYHKSQ
jgi:hypothetical protein